MTRRQGDKATSGGCVASMMPMGMMGRDRGGGGGGKRCRTQDARRRTPDTNMHDDADSYSQYSTVLYIPIIHHPSIIPSCTSSYLYSSHSHCHCHCHAVGLSATNSPPFPADLWVLYARVLDGDAKSQVSSIHPVAIHPLRLHRTAVPVPSLPFPPSMRRPCAGMRTTSERKNEK